LSVAPRRIDFTHAEWDASMVISGDNPVEPD